MPELSQLHELAAQVRTPDLADLAEVAERRRRRAGAALTATAAAGLVVVALVAASVSGHQGAAPLPVGPAPQPSPFVRTPRPDVSTSYPQLSAGAIRRHPSATVDADSPLATTAAPAGVAARIWTACLGDCSRATEYVTGEVQKALEVTHDDFATSSLYALDASQEASYAVDDWFFTEGRQGPQLVNSRGQRRALAVGATVPVTDVSGPPVHSSRGLAYVDLSARTVHLVEVAGPDQAWDWQGAGDTWFWGTAVLVDNGPVTRHAVVWMRPDGTFGGKVLAIPVSEGGPGMLTTNHAGTMAVVEHYAHPRVAHISTDYGVTWQVRRVPDAVPSGGALPADWTTWPRR